VRKLEKHKIITEKQEKSPNSWKKRVENSTKAQKILKS
jgi:hypothetical protein